MKEWQPVCSERWTDWVCANMSDLLPVAEHFFDVLQAQQAQLAEGGAAGLRGIESE